jgi:endonuclease YncB( thermonuclease family)
MSTHGRHGTRRWLCHQYRTAGVLSILLLWVPCLALVPLPAALDDGGTATVVVVIEGDTVVTAAGGEIRLVGIQAPKLPLGRPDFEPWPLADEAKALLGELTLGQEVRLGYGGLRMDRHGRALAHLFLDDGTWVQGEMLARGLARVYSFADNRALIPDMLTREGAARGDRLGVWSHPYYAVMAADDAAAHIDSFALVEGRVHAVDVVRGRAYLNFAEDWRRDFTITIAPRDLRLFARDGVAVESYEGRRVRVRGWLESYNGPMIEATHPEQIEILEE